MSSGNLRLRRLVGTCFVVLYLFLGVPLWYKLTTTYRAALPLEYIQSLHEDRLHDIDIVVPVYIRSETYNFPDLHKAAQIQVNNLLETKSQIIPWTLELMPYDAEKVKSKDYHVLNLILDQEVGFSLAYDSKEINIFFDDASVIANDLPFFIAQTLIEHVFAIEWEELSRGDNADANNMETRTTNVAISYKPNIHLSISLLTGDGYPISWEIDSTLKKYFSPLRRFLSPLVNFTVDTGILYYNDLNLHTLNNKQNVSEEDLSHAIDLSELLSMNYFLESSSLNLAIVFPGKENSRDGFDFIKDNWYSFLVPQWGVVVINRDPLEKNSLLTENYLIPIMYQFATDIFRLLNLKKDSKDLTSPCITIDSFKRITILQNIHKAQETLWSLVKLTQSFQTMSIPIEVLGNVTKALDLRLRIVDILNDPSQGGDKLWNHALVLSNKLVELSEAAFFHGEMVQQNFFPQEHKLAVYLPLLGPITVVIFLGFIRLIKERPDDKKRCSSESGFLLKSKVTEK